MKKILTLLALVGVLCLVGLAMLAGLPIFERRYGSPFETANKQFAASTLGTILNNCAAGNVAGYVAPALWDKFNPADIDRLCSILSRQFGTYQAFGDLVFYRGSYLTEGMITSDYLASARYDKGTPLMTIAVFKREKQRYVADISYATELDQRYGMPFEAESKQFAAATLGTILSNCTTGNVADHIAPALWDKFNPIDIDRLCSTLSQQFGIYQALGDLVPLVRYVRDYRTLGMDTFGWLAAARYDNGTPMIKIVIFKREKKWYVAAVNHAAD